MLNDTITGGTWTAMAEITDADPIRIEKSTWTGKEISPQRVMASWAVVDGNWKLTKLAVRGPLRKKDGSPGQITAEASYTGWSRQSSEPAWITTWVHAIPLPVLP
jgi:hypothetical protein